MSTAIAQALQPKNILVFTDEHDYVYLLNECAIAGFTRIPRDSRCGKDRANINAIIVLDNKEIQETHTDHHLYELNYYGSLIRHDAQQLRLQSDVIRK